MPAPPGFEEFVTFRSERLLRAAYQLTHDLLLAEDLLQTALARAWRVWSRLSGEADPEPYVRRIMFNTYASWWRRRWTHERPTGVLPERGEASVAAVQAERDRLWRALGRLTRRQRAVVVLRYYEDMTEAQVAEVLGCSVGSVKAHASRALATLRLDESLRPEGATT
ncbi:MAG TPA: SigE family RNA polymerase sigma factor [Micromonosporaceae bacterium]|nr:SigE family RNA polymerase sigma factor [Micromonosporaceae bacterium]